jgi:hypothetical protein
VQHRRRVRVRVRPHDNVLHCPAAVERNVLPGSDAWRQMKRATALTTHSQATQCSQRSETRRGSTTPPHHPSSARGRASRLQGGGYASCRGWFCARLGVSKSTEYTKRSCRLTKSSSERKTSGSTANNDNIVRVLGRNGGDRLDDGRSS